MPGELSRPSDAPERRARDGQRSADAVASGSDADRLRALEGLGAALAEARTAEEAARTFLEHATYATGASFGVIALLASDEAELELAGSVGLAAPLRDRLRRMPLDDPSPLCACARAERPLFIESRESLRDRAPEAASHLDLLAAAAIAAAPIRIEGRTRGVLALGFPEARRLDEETRRFTTVLAAQCAQAVLRAWIHDELRREAADMRRLHEFGSRLRSIDLQPVLREILRAVVALQDGATAGALMLRDREIGDLVVEAWVGVSDEFVRRARRIPPGAGASGTALVERRPVIVEDVEVDPRYEGFLEAVHAGGIRGVYAVPLLDHESQVLGAIATYFPVPHRPSAREMRLVELYARRAAWAVEAAELFQETRQAQEEAEAANRAKGDFLAVMSHELRTPLTAILGYTELLADEVLGPITDLQRLHLERVRSSGEQLFLLIQDLLSFSRLETGREQLDIDDVPLEEIIADAVGMTRQLADQKHLPIHVTLPEEPIRLCTDAHKLRQILVNLLANAVKFTDVGYVGLRAWEEERLVSISVRDTGVGIAPEHLQHIFDPFWQVDQRFTRSVGGTGLGLAVARQLSQLLGGEVAVVSAVGAGSTFTVRIPSRLEPVGAAELAGTRSE